MRASTFVVLAVLALLLCAYSAGGQLPSLPTGEETSLMPEPTPTPSLPSTEGEVEERVKEEVGKLTAEAAEEFSNIVGNISIEGMSNRWGGATEESTVIKTEVRVRNDNDIPLYVRRISFVMDMNNITMVTGESQDKILLRSKSVTKVSVESVMDNTRIPEWWVSHIRNGEKTLVEINVEITLEEIMGIPVSIPPCYGRSKITVSVRGKEIPMACIPTINKTIETNILGK